MPPFSCLLNAKLGAFEMHCSPVKLPGVFPDVPDVVWGALVAGAISLFTLLATLFFQAWQQKSKLDLESSQHKQKLGHEVELNKQKLDHEATEKARDRLHALRRDVYLPAMAATAKLPVLMSKLAMASTDEEAIGMEIAEQVSIVGRTAAVASVALTQQAVNYTVVMGRVHAALSMLRPKMVTANFMVQRYTDEEARATSNVRSAWEALSALQRQGVVSDAELLPCQKNISHAEEVQRYWRQQLAKAQTELWDAQLAVIREFRHQLQNAAPSIPKLVAALRAYIALSPDEEQLVEIYGAATSQSLKMLDESIAALEAIIKAST